MPIYKQTTEITNIDDIWTGVDKDIVEIYFGNKNVFTVWGEYEGTLPAAINANGDDMRQYQIYGSTGGVGERTVNLFDYEEWFDSGFVDYGQFFDYGIVQLSPYTTYTLTTSFGEGVSGNNVRETNLIVTVSGETPLTSVRGLSNVSPQTLTTNDDGNIYVYKRFRRNANSAPSVVVVTESMFENGQWMNIVEGTTAKTEYVPFGYKLDMVSRTENLYDKNNDSMNFFGYVDSQTRAATKSSGDSLSIIVPVEPNATYTIVKPATSRFRVGLFTSYPYVGEVATTLYGDRDNKGLDYGTSLTFNTSNNTSYILAFIRNHDDSQATTEQMKNSTMVLEGSTVPEFYIPYGNTTTQIYIGSDPLDKDEYVDYQAQKVYRMINGTLTPTDPPVPLPALPTCEGTTVIDYAGSGIVPEKVLLKYRKKNF